MENKKLPFTRFQVISMIISGILCVAMILMIIMAWNGLPDKIPSHFNYLGEPDGYGGKGSLFFLAGIGTLTVVLMVVVNFFPKTWNMAGGIKPDDELVAYTKMRNMLCVLTLIVAVMFFYINTMTIIQQSLGLWFLPIVLIITFGYSIYMMVSMFKYSDKK